jgi:hypothetical protein
MINEKIELKGLDSIVVKIGDNEYRLSNSQGNLSITGLDLGKIINIEPKSSNMIHIDQKKW